VHAFTGVGFIGATLVMARLLPVEAFGIATLLVAVANVGAQSAPSGFNGAFIRHNLIAERRLLLGGGVVALLAGVALAVLGRYVYELDGLACLLILVSVTSGGTALLATPTFQREQMFVRSVLLYQSANFALMLAAFQMLLGVGRNQWFAVGVTAAWFTVLVAPLWAWLLRRSREGSHLSWAHLHDVAHFFGVALSIQLMIQLERLVIPVVLDVEDLARFAVVAALALSPYRLLEMGTLSTLAARMRVIGSVASRRHLAKRETLTMLGLCVIAAVPILAFGPRISQLIAPDIAVGRGLLGLAVASGIVRVVGAQGRAIASAFAEPADLRLLNITGWLTVAFGALGGFALARWGLMGVMCGVSLGWIAKGVISFAVARKFLGMRS
jgi:hypothetical protein